MKYDFVIVGSGLFGCTCARLLSEAGLRILVIEKENKIGGLCATEIKNNIVVHLHGPHLWHCDDKIVWNFITKFGAFNNYQHKVKAYVDNKIYSLPFNMHTFHQLWGCNTPKEARLLLNEKRLSIKNPQNLEEQALSMLGEEIYNKFIYGYTLKHWRKNPKKLPSDIIRRLPIRFTYNDNYFNDAFQGVPIQGYTPLMENMLNGIEVKLQEDFFDMPDWRKISKNIIYTGPLDKLHNYCYGPLEYLSLSFKHKKLKGDATGIGQLNFPDVATKYTRSIEHKHFQLIDLPNTILTYEYSVKWDVNKPCYYPICTKENLSIHRKYIEKTSPDIYIGGRNGLFQYLDMDKCVMAAFKLCNQILN